MPRTRDKATGAQIRALHALVKRKGLGDDVHDEVRRVCGVQSLKHLTRSQAARAIDRLSEDRPDGRWNTQRAPRGETGPGARGATLATTPGPTIDAAGGGRAPTAGRLRLVNTPHGDVTRAQRETITEFVAALGWSDAMFSGWLRKHNGESPDIDALDHPEMTQGIASHVINQLYQALGKTGRKSRRASRPATTEPGNTDELTSDEALAAGGWQ